MAQNLSTKACIVGGGPAGMMLGVLLARAGVDSIVLEKYPDFFRDFRGDTIHPSTLQLLCELGWIDDFLKLPHEELTSIAANIAGERLVMGDFSRLPTTCKFIAFMPQWDFLKFLAEKGAQYPTLRVLMQTEGTGLVESGDRVPGIRAKNAAGEEFEIAADLVVGTDGRHSTIRAAAGFVVDNLGAPMDVLWMRIDKKPDDPYQALGNVNDGHVLITIDRDTYWQCAYLIPKGSYDALKAQGLEALWAGVGAALPLLKDRVKQIDDWSKVSLLEVRVDRLEKWHRPGVICIGDAAHAMSPIGGVGINLAIQDAVASANILWEALSTGTVDDELLAKVQQRRTFPTKVTQAFQVFIQNHAVTPMIEGEIVDRPPLVMRIISEFPLLRGLPARLIGMGARPEHVKSLDAFGKK